MCTPGSSTVDAGRPNCADKHLFMRPRRTHPDGCGQKHRMGGDLDPIPCFCPQELTRRRQRSPRRGNWPQDSQRLAAALLGAAVFGGLLPSPELPPQPRSSASDSSRSWGGRRRARARKTARQRRLAPECTPFSITTPFWPYGHRYLTPRTNASSPDSLMHPRNSMRADRRQLLGHQTQPLLVGHVPLSGDFRLFFGYLRIEGATFLVTGGLSSILYKKCPRPKSGRRHVDLGAEQ